MNRALAAALALAALSPLATPEASAASSGGYRMEVLVGGRVATEYAARGTRYIEARQGREYTIRLTNPTSRRVGVALSVDGLNTIDARRTTAEDATKWILDPYETVEIRGWQTSGSTSRAFYFTSEEQSYGAWMGDTRNLGVISAVFFPERVQEPSWWQSYDDGWYGDEQASADRERRSGAPAPSAEAAAPSAATGSAGAGRAEASRQKADSDSLAATGIGRERGNLVTAVEVDLEDSPAASLSVRYEYRSELIRLGVMPKPQPRPTNHRETSTGFEDMSFAPDPYARIR